MSTPKTPLELAALATVAVPGMRVSGLRGPQYTDELVSVTGIIDANGNRWTVTSPHDALGGLDLEDQDALLKRLSQAYTSKLIPFRVPQPVGLARLKDGTRVIVHNDLGGRFIDEPDFADPHLLPASLGRALAHLHNLPVGLYTGIDLPSYTSIELRDRHLAILDQAATHTLIPANLWNRWEGALSDISLWRFATTPIHGRLQRSSIVVHEGAVRSMSGFTAAHVGDPATDYAWILAQADDAFLERFREAYSMTRPLCDLHIETRAQLISELAIVQWLMRGIRADDHSVVKHARHMLDELANDLGDQALVAEPLSPAQFAEVSPLAVDEATDAAFADKDASDIDVVEVVDLNNAGAKEPAAEWKDQGDDSWTADALNDDDPATPTQYYEAFRDEASQAPTTVLNLDEFGRPTDS